MYITSISHIDTHNSYQHICMQKFFKEIKDLKRHYDATVQFSKRLKEDILELSEKLNEDPMILGLEASLSDQTSLESMTSSKVLCALNVIEERVESAHNVAVRLAPYLLVKGTESGRETLMNIQSDLDVADISDTGTLSRDRFEHVLSLCDLGLTTEEVKEVASLAVARGCG